MLLETRKEPYHAPTLAAMGVARLRAALGTDDDSLTASLLASLSLASVLGSARPGDSVGRGGSSVGAASGVSASGRGRQRQVRACVVGASACACVCVCGGCELLPPLSLAHPRWHWHAHSHPSCMRRGMLEAYPDEVLASLGSYEAAAAASAAVGRSARRGSMGSGIAGTTPITPSPLHTAAATAAAATTSAPSGVGGVVAEGAAFARQPSFMVRRTGVAGGVSSVAATVQSRVGAATPAASVSASLLGPCGASTSVSAAHLSSPPPNLFDIAHKPYRQLLYSSSPHLLRQLPSLAALLEAVVDTASAAAMHDVLAFAGAGGRLAGGGDGAGGAAAAAGHRVWRGERGAGAVCVARTACARACVRRRRGGCVGDGGVPVCGEAVAPCGLTRCVCDSASASAVAHTEHRPRMQPRRPHTHTLAAPASGT